MVYLLVHQDSHKGKQYFLLLLQSWKKGWPNAFLFFSVMSINARYEQHESNTLLYEYVMTILLMLLHAKRSCQSWKSSFIKQTHFWGNHFLHFNVHCSMCWIKETLEFHTGHATEHRNLPHMKMIHHAVREWQRQNSQIYAEMLCSDEAFLVKLTHFKTRNPSIKTATYLTRWKDLEETWPTKTRHSSNQRFWLREPGH